MVIDRIMKKTNISDRMSYLPVAIMIMLAVGLFFSGCDKKEEQKPHKPQQSQGPDATTKDVTTEDVATEPKETKTAKKDDIKGEAKKWQVSGKVIDADTGKPIANIPYSVDVRSQDKRDYFDIVSDDKGEFSLSVKDKSKLYISLKHYEITKANCDIKAMRQNGTERVIIPTVTADKDDIELKVKIIPSVKLTCTVLDENNQPASNAYIYYNQFLPPMTTDKNGVFHFNLAPKYRDYELFMVSSGGSGGKLLKVAKGTTSLNVTLVPTFNVEGKAVADDGKPAEKLQFRTALLLNGTHVSKLGSQHTTDQDGNFKIKNACEGLSINMNWYSSSDMNANYWQGGKAITPQRGQAVTLNVRRFIDNWQAPGNIAISETTKCKQLSNYCLDAQDNILACDKADKVIRKISPEDKLLATWKLDFGPEAIDCKSDGTVIVTGSGKIALLDKSGKVVCENDVKGKASSGVGFSKNDIFVATRQKTGYAIVRMNDKLQEQKVIVKKLRGCCGQFDITARDEHVYAAANCNFRIQKYNREGKLVLEMGEKGSSVEKGFDGCCEPKNVCFDNKGNLYASESGNCCVKKFSADGKSFEMIGKVNGIRGCVRVSIAVNAKGTKIYMLDTGRNIIRCLPVTAKTAELKKDTNDQPKS